MGYDFAYGADIAPGAAQAERHSYDRVILQGRLENALRRINPHLLDETIEVVVPKLISPGVPVLEDANVAFHRMLARGMDVQVRPGTRSRPTRPRFRRCSGPMSWSSSQTAPRPRSAA